MTTTNTYGRQVVVPLTNKSGGGVIAGDVVIVGTANNDAFTTTSSAAFTGSVGIAQETIADNATGRILLSGYAALVNTTASVTRQNFGTTSTTVKKAVDAGSSRTTGTFCQFLTGGTTPDAIVWQPDLGAGTALGAWTDYTPTMTGGAGFNLGSSTLVGRYKLLDSKTGVVKINLTVTTGGAWNAGAGTWTMTLPSGWTTPNDGRIQTLAMHINDASTTHFAGVAKILPNDTKTTELHCADDATPRVVDQNSPVTWATGDTIDIMGIIEIA